MTETQHLQQSFKDLYNGKPWLDVTLLGTLSEIPAHKAAHKPREDMNSIWEITNHLIAWRENVLQRIQGNEIVTPDDNYFSYIIDTSEIAWLYTLKRLDESQQKWIGFLKDFQSENLEQIYKPNNHKHFEHIIGIIQHDAYHLGQIVMLAKHAI